MVGAVTAGVLLLSGCGDDSGEPASPAPAGGVTEPTPEKGDLNEVIGGGAEDTARKLKELMDTKAISPIPVSEGAGGESALYYKAIYQQAGETGELEISISRDRADGSLDEANIYRVGLTQTKTSADGQQQGETFEYVKFADPNSGPGMNQEVWGFDITPEPFVDGSVKSYGGLNDVPPDLSALTQDIMRLESLLESLEGATLTPAL